MITLRHTIPSDSPGLIDLCSSTPMKGKISIRIDRKPDFFKLLRERGLYIALVAENEKKEIVGSFSAARQKFYLNEKAISVYYLGDLKVHPGYAGTSLAYRIVHRMYNELKERDADILFCTAADGNDAVMSFFTGRAGIPEFIKISRFGVYQLLPKKNKTGHSLHQSPDYNEKLLSFYSAFYTRYTFYPELKHLHSCTHFVKEKDGKIIAALSVTDTNEFKQNVLINYPATITIALKMLRVLSYVLPLPELPDKGSSLKIAYVRYWGCDPLSETVLLGLINEARDWAFKNKYHFLSIAADTNDEWITEIMKKRKQFVFYSNGLATSIKSNNKLIESIRNGISYEDYSLV